jgi:hypothetical protein
MSRSRILNDAETKLRALLARQSNTVQTGGQSTGESRKSSAPRRTRTPSLLIRSHSYGGGKRWPLVATADIAAKAACWLLDRGWSGHHRVGVHGPKDLSTDEAAAIISSALGKPVKIVDATIDQARGAMKGMGMPDFVVEIVLEQYGAFRDGRLDSAEPRTPDTTTPTPSSRGPRSCPRSAPSSDLPAAQAGWSIDISRSSGRPDKAVKPLLISLVRGTLDGERQEKGRRRRAGIFFSTVTLWLLNPRSVVCPFRARPNV